jgi:hypothetical protein
VGGECLASGVCQQAANSLVVQAQIYGPQIANFLTVYGPNILQLEQAAEAAGKQSADKGGGNAGNGEPEDPFRNLPQKVRDKIENLKQQSQNRRLYNPFRLGAKAQLERTEYYARQGELKDVETWFQGEAGNGRFDIVLKGQNTAVEVKYWSQEFLTSNYQKLLNQLTRQQAAGKNVVLEMYQTQTDPITRTSFDQLVNNLQKDGINLSGASLLPPIAP